MRNQNSNSLLMQLGLIKFVGEVTKADASSVYT